MYKDDLSGETLEMTVGNGKLTMESIMKFLKAAHNMLNKRSYIGKQSIKKFNRSNLQTNSVDNLESDDIKAIRAELKHYKVDFSVVKDKDTGTQTLYFRAKDLDIINKAFENLIKKGIKKSIPDQLKEAREKAAVQMDDKDLAHDRDPNRDKDRGMEH